MKKWLIFLFFCGLANVIVAQSLPDLFRKAETLRLNYQFEDAAVIFSAIIQQSADSLLSQQAEQQLILCENGRILLDYAETPMVTGKITVPEETFFHYYAIPFGGNWATVPIKFLQNTPTEDFLSPVFVPEKETDLLYFSSQITDHWDIYVTRRTENNVWTAPEPVLGSVNTFFDERFPYVVPDGKTLYFSSNGHSGMGGYDLFKSTFDPVTQQWNAPENLGFPYSSPYDDWLFVPNIDQTEALFASSREQRSGELTLYRIRMETNPIKQSGYALSDIQQIAQLRPVQPKPEKEPAPDYPEENAGAYQTLYHSLHQQQQSEQTLQNNLQVARNQYAGSKNNADKKYLQQKILTGEEELAVVQAAIRQTTERIRQVEQQLLEKGISPELIRTWSNAETTAFIPLFLPVFKPATVFPAGSFLPSPEKPEEEKDKYAFNIGKLSVIIDHPPVTEGLIYRIQIGTFSRRLPSEELKGLSPVFIRPGGNLFIHYVGQFTSYNEVQKALPVVKKQGFRDALIVAFDNGKKILVKAAHEQELKKPAATEKPVTPSVFNVILGEFPDGLPAALQIAVQEYTRKDIIKSSSKGNVVYMVGPFGSTAEAQQLQQQLQLKGFEVTVE